MYAMLKSAIKFCCQIVKTTVGESTVPTPVAVKTWMKYVIKQMDTAAAVADRTMLAKVALVSL